MIEVGEIAHALEPKGQAKADDIGHYKVTAGTFGALVNDARTVSPHSLSNHVLANATGRNDGKSAIGTLYYNLAYTMVGLKQM